MIELEQAWAFSGSVQARALIVHMEKRPNIELSQGMVKAIIISICEANTKARRFEEIQAKVFQD